MIPVSKKRRKKRKRMSWRRRSRRELRRKGREMRMRKRIEETPAWGRLFMGCVACLFLQGSGVW